MGNRLSLTRLWEKCCGDAKEEELLVRPVLLSGEGKEHDKARAQRSTVIKVSSRWAVGRQQCRGTVPAPASAGLQASHLAQSVIPL